MGKRRRERPIIKKKNAGGEHNGLRYAVASMQGWRTTMEDSHRVSLTLPGEMNDWAFAGVYDGHGGEKVSTYTSKNLLQRILKNIPQRNEATDDSQNAQEQNSNNNPVDRQQVIKDGIAASFLNLDNTMRKSKKIDDNSGTTAVCVLITDSHFYFANCGDSRAILCRQEKVFFATKDHKPTSKPEKKRIEAAGGKVKRKRVNGGLALSRALGDFDYKKNTNKGQCDQMVTPQPDITVIERNNQTDHFIILACDGVFDVMSNYELVAYIRTQMAKTKNLKTVCNNVVDHCLEKGSGDNISVIILTLPNCPSHEDMMRKRKLNLDKMTHDIRNKKARICSNPSLTLNEQVSSTSESNCQQIVEPRGNVSSQNTKPDPKVLRRNHNKVPNPFIIYFMDHWKKKGGNVCKRAKECGERWSRMTQSLKQKYRRRFLQTRRRRNLKTMKSLKSTQVPQTTANSSSNSNEE